MPDRYRPITMRRSSLLLGTAALAVLLAPSPPPPATASCSGPYLIDTDHLVLERGTTATVEGRSFVDGCQDSVGCQVGFGCDDCEYDEPPERAREDIALRLVQAGRSWDLDVADAGAAADDHLGWVTWSFTVPRSADPGAAKLVAGYERAVKIRIR